MSFCFMCIHRKDCRNEIFNCPFYMPKSCETCKHEYKAITAHPCIDCDMEYNKWEGYHK